MRRAIDYDAHHANVERACESRGIAWPQCGFDIGPGWLPIVERALDEMIAAGWDRDLQQVKQKFCGLRIYIGESNEAIVAAIHKAEAECAKSCEHCGKPHGLEIPKLGSALCEECRSRR